MYKKRLVRGSGAGSCYKAGWSDSISPHSPTPSEAKGTPANRTPKPGIGQAPIQVFTCAFTQKTTFVPMRWRLLLWIGIGFWIEGCRKGELRPKEPPLARFFVDSIGLEGNNRLTSRFKLGWWGEDPDGYVVGYELRIDGGEWHFTTRQESTFVVNFEPGTIDKDLVFELRAVDNDGLKTEPPARLRVPLRNSPPTCRLDPSAPLPDTTLPAITLVFQVDDPEGRETLDSLYLRIGQSGSWWALPVTQTTFTLVPEDPGRPSPTRIFRGTDPNPLSIRIDPLPLGDTVRLYFRVRDNARLYSPIDSTKLVYIRPQTGPWLVIDNWATDEAINTLTPDFNAAWPEGYDVWNLRSPAQQVPLYNPTWIRLFRLYSRIFWIGGGEPERFRRLEEVEAVIQTYLLNGGRLLVNSPLRNDIEPSSPVFRWGPMDSLSSTTQNGLLASNGPVSPLDAAFPPLSNGLPYFMSLINPPYPKGTAIPLYEMPGLVQGNGQPWPAGLPRAAAVAFPQGTTSGKYRQIFFILPLHQLSGNRIAFLQAVNTAFQP